MVPFLTERHNQIELVRWLRWKRVLFLGTLNGEFGLGGARSGMVAIAQAKQVGLEKGAPDILLLEPRGGYHGLALELKHAKGGVLSSEQKVWLEALRRRGYMAVCKNGAPAAIKCIADYLDGQFRAGEEESEDSTSDYDE